MRSEVFNCDCIDFMRTLPDNAFQLVLADPPYGVSYARGKNGWGVCDNRPELEDVKLDSQIPEKAFFDELLRIGEKVIIWGGNYFTHLLPMSKCWLVWDKCDGTENKSVFADAELAWTNMSKVVRIFRLRQIGFISDTQDKERFHPTQKPTELYGWLIRNFAQEGDTIFDPMMGSQSSRIAAYKMGYDFVGCELDKEYFDKGCARFDKVCKGEYETKNGRKVKELSLFE